MNLKQISILGFGKSSRSAVEYLLANSVPKIKVSDLQPRAHFDEKLIVKYEDAGVDFEFGLQSLDFLKGSDFVMLSPGIPPSAPIIKDLKEEKLTTGTDIDLFCQDADNSYIAVTGTNGKTTTSTLIAHIFDSKVLGNIGKPVLTFETLSKKKFKKITRDIEINPTQNVVHAEEIECHVPYVLELSSFQLFYSSMLKAPKVGVYLNFSSDHLDWHSSLDEYREAKEKLFLLQGRDDYAVLNFDDPKISKLVENLNSPERLMAGKTPRIRTFSTKSKLDWMHDSAYLDGDKLVLSKANESHVLVTTKELNLVGEHNYSNILAAALAADSFGISIETIKEKIKSFQPVEHRMEYVASINGKDIYNDSKATNPDSAIRAFESFEKSIAIVGGKDKKLELDSLIAVLKDRAAMVITIGEIRHKIKSSLEKQGYTNISVAETLEESIKKALEHDKKLPIIFSPASSSFDMFLNFEDRGNKFKEIVKKLEGVLQ